MSEWRPDLVERLAAAVGPDNVLADPAVRASYEVDWTRRWRGSARLVVRPGTTGEVAAVVAACAEAGVPIVPQGGNTGLVGGGVPAGVADGIVLSLRRLDRIEPVTPAGSVVAGSVVAGAGTTLGAVQRHARAAGWEFGVDFAARDSATVGGAVATNAGGMHVVRHGTARAQLLGVEAVLAAGTVVSRVDGPVKDSTGYDLAALFAGSEGTLAVLTRLRLRLVPAMPFRAVALLGVDGVAAAQAVLGRLRSELDTVSAAELFFRAGLELVLAATGAAAPFPQQWPAYLLVECAGRADPTDDLVSALAGAGGVGDAAIAADAADRARLWRYREAHPEAIGAVGVPVKLDVAVPPAALPAAEPDLRAAAAAVVPAARVIVFGHLAEANLHVNVLDVPDDAAASVTDAVLRAVAEHGGSISAEHGVGRAKAPWLGLTRSAAEIAAMRAVKAALDPQGLLNPGVIFES